MYTLVIQSLSLIYCEILNQNYLTKLPEKIWLLIKKSNYPLYLNKKNLASDKKV